MNRIVNLVELKELWKDSRVVSVDFLKNCRNEIAGWYDDSHGRSADRLPIIQEIDKILAEKDFPYDV